MLKWMYIYIYIYIYIYVNVGFCCFLIFSARRNWGYKSQIISQGDDEQINPGERK